MNLKNEQKYIKVKANLSYISHESHLSLYLSHIKKVEVIIRITYRMQWIWKVNSFTGVDNVDHCPHTKRQILDIPTTQSASGSLESHIFLSNALSALHCLGHQH